MEGAKQAKIDVSHVHLHLKLNEEAQKVLVINTYRKLFKCLHLPFGANIAGGMFQHAIKQLLYDLDEVECNLDDIRITCEIKEEHDTRLQAVLDRLYNKGFHLRKEKYFLGVIELQFL